MQSKSEPIAVVTPGMHVNMITLLRRWSYRFERCLFQEYDVWPGILQVA